MTREHIDLITRLSTSNINTDDFMYLKSFVDGSRTCRTCIYFGDTDEDWNQEECTMSVIGNPNKEYCWNWISKDDC